MNKKAIVPKIPPAIPSLGDLKCARSKMAIRNASKANRILLIRELSGLLIVDRCEKAAMSK
ncbi:hypothetical protein IFO69_17550 [Echinicola sp. CAU 1574]|uniref:Uncharacterized protein n=1 Tax=Echinicola arenosa TaxID=2774144 RepID=A0ABR9AQC1_9BACT|nr:hypothetical protein [Echinicola arenosa]MBD8490562.1 hypothetical protein [Echinicola arenosa]